MLIASFYNCFVQYDFRRKKLRWSSFFIWMLSMRLTVSSIMIHGWKKIKLIQFLSQNITHERQTVLSSFLARTLSMSDKLFPAVWFMDGRKLSWSSVLVRTLFLCDKLFCALSMNDKAAIIHSNLIRLMTSLFIEDYIHYIPNPKIHHDAWFILGLLKKIPMKEKRRRNKTYYMLIEFWVSFIEYVL